MRRRTLIETKIYGGVEVEASKAAAGDFCFYSKKNDNLVIVPYSKWTYDLYPLTHYTPVGVVVVPGSHKVYGVGTCAIMSCYDMSTTTPDIGSTTYERIKFGCAGNLYMTNLNKVASVCLDYEDTAGDANGTIVGEKTVASSILPTNYSSDGVKCPHDTDTYYLSSSYSLAPSPYLSNNARNTTYYQTSSPTSSANCLSDFDGVGNTGTRLKYATSQSGWKTASTITNEGGSRYSPACCCCWRYHTDGTKQGDWYLPAMGELGYIAPKLKNIQRTLKKIVDEYGVGVILSMGYNSTYLSSSYSEREDYPYDRTSGIILGNCQMIDPYCDNGNGFVRAFLRVS